MDEDVVAMSTGERGTGFQLLFVSHPNFRVRTGFGYNREFEVCSMQSVWHVSVDCERWRFALWLLDRYRLRLGVMTL